MMRCPECNAIIADGEVNCPDCGFILLRDTDVSRKVGGRKFLVIGIVLLLLLAAGSGFVALRHFQLKKQLDLGTDYLAAGQFIQALDAFEKALNIDDDNTEARLGHARSLIALYRYEEAEDVLEKIIKGKPAVVDAWQLLCEVKLAREDFADVFACIEQCHQTLGDDVLASLYQELAAGISIVTDKEQFFSGEWADLQLLYASQGIEVLLSPQWSVPDMGQLHAQADGSAKVSMDSQGELRVSAAFGPIEREVVLTFNRNGAQQAAELVKNFSYPFLLPQFTNPDKLDNEIVLILLINWVQRYTGVEKYVISAEEVEDAATAIFGPGLQLEHEENYLAWWNADRAEYEIIPMGLDSAAMTFIIDCREETGKYIVNAVHLTRILDWNEEDKCIVEDDNGTVLGRYDWDELETVFNQERLAQLPLRRYFFSVLPDGSYYMTESQIIY